MDVIMIVVFGVDVVQILKRYIRHLYIRCWCGKLQKIEKRAGSFEQFNSQKAFCWYCEMFTVRWCKVKGLVLQYDRCSLFRVISQCTLCFVCFRSCCRKEHSFLLMRLLCKRYLKLLEFETAVVSMNCSECCCVWFCCRGMLLLLLQKFCCFGFFWACLNTRVYGGLGSQNLYLARSCLNCWIFYWMCFHFCCWDCNSDWNGYCYCFD